ncbi:MAG: NapC/NirT family cytochrome c [Vicinamibacterales bacterium]
MADSDRSVSEPALARNPVSLAGTWVTTLAVFAFVTYLALEGFGLLASPYSGLFGFLIVPAVFAVGLLLIPLGIWIESRRRKRGKPAWHWPAIDLNNARTRGIIAAVVGLTLVNVVIVAVASVGAVEYSESNSFCGQLCHVPMQPEFTAHQFSAHAKIKCVNCHVAPGASGALTAKMNGTRQLYRLVTGTYARPIPSPRDRIPVPAATCQQCHSAMPPERVTERAFVEHKNDEKNTELKTTMSVYLGRIHWHARPDVVVEYIASDNANEVIPYVKVTEKGKTTTEYLSADAKTKPAGLVRRMDCLDCHNRPAHLLTDTPEGAVDRALVRGEVSADLPFVRRDMVAALSGDYPDEGAALQAISDRLNKALGAGSQGVAQAVQVTQRLYSSNIFPKMKITWGTYKNQLLHPDQSGCFRCHDDEHKAVGDAEKVVRQDCEMCHLEQEVKP